MLVIRMMAIPLLYLDYNLRKDYIVQNLCENRLKPQMNCNGKCYLAKRIALSEQRETTEKGAAFAHILFEIPYYIPAKSVVKFDFYSESITPQLPNYSIIYSSEYSSSHFRPPAV